MIKIILILISVFLLHLLFRNEKTLKYKIDLCNRVNERARRDIYNGIEPKYYYDDMPSYYYVLFSMKIIRDENFLCKDMIEWLNE